MCSGVRDVKEAVRRVFFFSSRRRHTRCLSDWSSDVCSSDLSNEAFAAQAMGVNKELGMNPAKVNPNGGAVALGHPIGATGCILTIKAIYELQRTGGRYGLITMCIGGGQGIAAIIERM